MAFKISFMEKVSWFLASLNGKNYTECTLSISPNKKFSDIKNYIESGKFGTSMAGKVTKQIDTGFMYEYEYVFDGKNLYGAGGYTVRISHIDEKVNNLTLFTREPAASVAAKMKLNKLEEKVPDAKD